MLINTSCSTHQSEDIVKPEKYIPKEEFLEIMIDVRLVETVIRQKISLGGDIRELTRYYYKDLFAKHNIDKEQLNANVEYYASFPEEMADINEQIVEYLSELESEVKEQKHIEKGE